MFNKIAVYAGSFDPFTKGHESIIRQARDIGFDKLIIAIGRNPNKRYFFSEEERAEHIRYWAYLQSNFRPDFINVDIMGNKYLADYAKEVQATHIVRGLRSVDDFNQECLLRDFNMSHWPIEHTYFMAHSDTRHISSSFVKGLIGYEGWEKEIRKYTFVADFIIEKVKKIVK